MVCGGFTVEELVGFHRDIVSLEEHGLPRLRTTNVERLRETMTVDGQARKRGMTTTLLPLEIVARKDGKFGVGLHAEFYAS